MYRRVSILDADELRQRLITLAASSGKRNVTAWSPSVRQSVRLYRLFLTLIRRAAHSIRKVYVDLYSAFLREAPQMRSDMDHTLLPANYTMPAFTPQPQNITALWLVLILPSHGG